MTDLEEARIDSLHTVNLLFKSEDYINSLVSSIQENNPTKKWKEIAKELNTITIHIGNAKLLVSRMIDELEKQCEINWYYSTKKDEVLYKLRNFSKLEKENKNLKNKIEEWLVTQ